MKVEFKVSSYVLTLWGDETEVEVFLQNKPRENAYDYDVKLDFRGDKAFKIDELIEMGDKIVMDLPNSWNLDWGGDDVEK